VPQPHHNLLVYIHLHSNSDHYPGNAPLQPNFRDEGALFCALGWYVTRNETLRQFGKARTDVNLGTPQLVDLIYTLGGLYYHADMIKPLAGCRHTRFDPTGMEYHHAGNPGCYSSNMTGILDYVLVIKHLGEAFDDAYVKDLLLLTMYYDFMSYLALTYAQSIRVGLALLQARTTVVLQLQSLLQLTDLADDQDIIRLWSSLPNRCYLHLLHLLYHHRYGKLGYLDSAVLSCVLPQMAMCFPPAVIHQSMKRKKRKKKMTR
jgi:hypothetical protein